MDILAATLCDFASVYEGKLCVMGAFDTIASRQFPASHPQCSVAMRVVFREEDAGRHRIEVRFIDPDGKPILEPQTLPRVEFEIKSLPQEVYFLSRNFIFNYHGLPLPSAGQYETQILIDGVVSRSLPLQFVQASPATYL
jgi:hypothetical protein